MKHFIQSTLALVLLAAVSFPAVAGSNPGNQIAGFWDATATVSTPDGDFELPPSHASMTRDGGMTVNSPGGSATGGWKRIFGRFYDITFVSFDALSEDVFLKVTVNATVELSADGQQFIGPFRTSGVQLDASGETLLFVLEGTVEAERVPISGF